MVNHIYTVESSQDDRINDAQLGSTIINTTSTRHLFAFPKSVWQRLVYETRYCFTIVNLYTQTMFWNRQRAVEAPQLSQREQLHEDIPRLLASIRESYDEILALNGKQFILAGSYAGLPSAYARYCRLFESYHQDKVTFVNKWDEVDESRLCQLLARGSIDDQLEALEKPELISFHMQAVLNVINPHGYVNEGDIDSAIQRRAQTWMEREPDAFVTTFNGVNCSYENGNLIYNDEFASEFQRKGSHLTCTITIRFRIATEQVAAQRRELKSLNFALQGDSGIDVLTELADSLISLKSLADSLTEQLHQIIVTLENEEVDELEELDELAEGAMKLLDTQFRF